MKGKVGGMSGWGKAGIVAGGALATYIGYRVLFKNPRRKRKEAGY